MVEPGAVAAFLADCWRADSRAGGIGDLFGRNVEQLRCLGRDPLAGLGAPRVALAPDDPLIPAAELSRREKAPVIWALAIAGPVRAGQRRRTRLAAPLWVWSSELQRANDGAEIVGIDPQPRVNLAAIEPWCSEEGQVEELARSLEQQLPRAPWGAGTGFAVASVLSELLPGLGCSGLDHFPDRLGSEQDLRAGVAGDRLVVVSAMGVALVWRGVATRGIDDELRQIAAAGTELSRPLRVALGGVAEPTPAPPRRRRSPAVLSRPQVAALATAATAPLSVLVGPPGTGKSFTMAAIALDAVARGESVLIASSREQAVAVVEAKTRELAGPWLVPVRAGRGEVHRELTASLDALLHGDLGALGPPSARRARQLESEVARSERRVARRQGRLETLLAAEADDDRSPTGRLRALWRRALTLGAGPLWEEFAEWERDLQALGPKVTEWLRVARRERVEAMLARHRDQLVALRRAIGARRSGDQERWFHEVDAEAVHAAFPLWSTTFADAYRALPFERERFDLVIIDEATQCDSASALPILQRGRRALVTGDPQQLRHVSFLADAAQVQLAERHGLGPAEVERWDYRRRSLLDVVVDAVPSASAVVRLDEHFRSTPGIIEFSNRQFYGGRLAVMTRRPSTLVANGLRLVRADGSRAESGVNAREVEVALAEIAALMKAEGPASRPRTLGLATPFRAHADALAAACAERFTLAEIERHQLLVATVWGFQGEERDAVVLSLALDAESPSGAWRYLGRPDLFNVAVTRARELQVVVTSLPPQHQPPIELLARYLDQFDAPANLATASAPVDRFRTEVASALRQRGLRVWEHFEVAGTSVDLLLETPRGEVALDLVGGAGGAAPALEIERARMIGRAGLRLLPIPWSVWAREPERVLAAVAAATG